MTEFSEFEFKLEFAALDFIGRNGMNKQTTCSFFFWQNHNFNLHGLFLLEKQTIFRSDLLFLFNNLNIFLMNSISFMLLKSLEVPNGMKERRLYYLKFKILKLPDMFKFESAVFIFKFNKQLLPSPFSHYFSKSNTKHYQLTRGVKSGNYFLPFYRTNELQNSIKYHGPKFWNSLPIEPKLCKSLKSFKRKLKKFFLNKYTC